MILPLWLPVADSPRLVEAELVDVRRDNHDLEIWSKGYGPAVKESYYFTLIAKAASRIQGPGWEYDLHAGEGLFVAPGEEIRATFGEGPILRSYNLHFNLVGITKDEALRVFPRTVAVADDTARLRNTLDCLIDATLRHAEMLQACEFGSLMLELARIPLRREVRNLSPLVHGAMDIIHRSILDNPSRESVAAELGVTSNHLSAVIKSETGRTITRHLQDARIRAAKDLIYSRNLNVSEVSALLGMDIHSFSRLFKSVTGKSPAQYRKETMTGLPVLTPLVVPDPPTMR